MAVVGDMNVLDETYAGYIPHIVREWVGEHVCLRFLDQVIEMVVLLPFLYLSSSSKLSDRDPLDNLLILVSDRVDLSGGLFIHIHSELFFIIACMKNPFTTMVIHQSYFVGKAQ